VLTVHPELLGKDSGHQPLTFMFGGAEGVELRGFEPLTFSLRRAPK
jgi:hypothetical protein